MRQKKKKIRKKCFIESLKKIESCCFCCEKNVEYLRLPSRFYSRTVKKLVQLVVAVVSWWEYKIKNATATYFGFIFHYNNRV